jgi:hypothetical protein
MNALNVAGLLVSTAGSALFIWAEWTERRERSNKEKPVLSALKDLRDAKKELAEYAASLRATNKRHVEAELNERGDNLMEQERKALSESEARMTVEVERRTKPYRDAVDTAQARWDAVTEPDLADVDLRGLPPDLHIRGFALLLVGFLFQLAGEVFGP